MKLRRVPRLIPEFNGLGTTTTHPITAGAGGFRHHNGDHEHHYELLLCGEHATYPLAGRLLPLNLDSIAAVVSDLTAVPRAAVRLQMAEAGLAVDATTNIFGNAFRAAGVPMRLVVRRIR